MRRFAVLFVPVLFAVCILGFIFSFGQTPAQASVFDPESLSPETAVTHFTPASAPDRASESAADPPTQAADGRSPEQSIENIFDQPVIERPANHSQDQPPPAWLTNRPPRPSSSPDTFSPPPRVVMSLPPRSPAPRSLQSVTRQPYRSPAPAVVPRRAAGY